jgi:xylulokinase
VTRVSREEVTIGIDIGTTAVKAVAADGHGTVLARARVPHRLKVPAPDRLEHDADEAWRSGPLTALEQLGQPDARAIAVSAMVPSLTSVDSAGVPLTPGLLYGDSRGWVDTPAAGVGFMIGETAEFLRWTAHEVPDAAGYWPASAVANYALGGDAVIDFATAFTTLPLFDGTGWNEQECTGCGASADRMPRVEAPGVAIGEVRDRRTVLSTGAIDATCEQMVAGADRDGDVLVQCGTTLLVWATIPEFREVPGLWTIPHTAAGKCQIGGASNAGGLFLNWVDGLVAPADSAAVNPGAVPIWTPYIRGERTPYHDPHRRARLDGLTLASEAASVRRGAYEASGFVVRHLIELGGTSAERIVATGGGTRVEPWMQAIADATGLPVEVSTVPEGAALGAAYLARMGAGLESSMADAARWASTKRTIEPNPAWQHPMDDRYGRFLQLTGERQQPASN